MNCHKLICILIASITFWSAQSVPASPFSTETETWLQKLDEELLNVDYYIQLKQERIEQLVARKRLLRNAEEIYFQNKLIYDECMTFDSQLAMDIVDENIAMSRRSNNKEQLLEWSIKRSFVLASTGLFHESLQAVEGVRARVDTHELLLQYYNQMQYLYSHMWMYTLKGQLKDEYQALNECYNDSVYAILEPTDPEYLWHKGWRDLGTDNAEATIEALRQEAGAQSLDSRPVAMLYYVLARMYEAQGEADLNVQYLAKSSIADICAANQDIASLEELAIKMHDAAEQEQNGQSFFALDNDELISRAYDYISTCLHTTQKYDNRVRTVSISRVLDQILQAYLLRDTHQRDRLKKSLWTVSVLLLLLLLGIVGVWIQNKKLGRSRHALALANDELKQNQMTLAEVNDQLVKANARLQDSMNQLTDVNQQLHEADLVKEEYIGYLFTICSNYISKLDDFRKNINRKAKVKLYDEVLQLTDKNTLVQDELKEFYQNFDAIFLHLYPDFVTQFNELLLPEERIEPRKGELLNTDLRIYALVRLGINDSVKIAEFLHCSPQTVYNNRLKIRNKTILPKEDFLHTVQHLGHPENFTGQKT